MIDQIREWADRQLFQAQAYQKLFQGRDAEIVLGDLAHFCHLGDTTICISQKTGQSDALAMAYAEGQRSVLLRIQKKMRITHDQIMKIADEVAQ